MGAGDVKLLAGVGAWFHASHTFYAKSTQSLDAPIRVSIQGTDGELGKAVINKLSTGWTKYEAAIRVTGTDEKARLVIVTTGEGSVWDSGNQAASW